MQKQEPEAAVCPSPDAYVEARVLQRLLDRGVKRARAEAVARKVRRKYAVVRSLRLASLEESAERARESDLRVLQEAARSRQKRWQLDREQ